MDTNNYKVPGFVNLSKSQEQRKRNSLIHDASTEIYNNYDPEELLPLMDQYENGDLKDKELAKNFDRLQEAGAFGSMRKNVKNRLSITYGEDFDPADFVSKPSKKSRNAANNALGVSQGQAKRNRNSFIADTSKSIYDDYEPEELFPLFKAYENGKLADEELTGQFDRLKDIGAYKSLKQNATNKLKYKYGEEFDPEATFGNADPVVKQRSASQSVSSSLQKAAKGLSADDMDMNKFMYQSTSALLSSDDLRTMPVLFAQYRGGALEEGSPELELLSNLDKFDKLEAVEEHMHNRLEGKYGANYMDEVENFYEARSVIGDDYGEPERVMTSMSLEKRRASELDKMLGKLSPSLGTAPDAQSATNSMRVPQATPNSERPPLYNDTLLDAMRKPDVEPSVSAYTNARIAEPTNNSAYLAQTTQSTTLGSLLNPAPAAQPAPVTPPTTAPVVAQPAVTPAPVTPPTTAPVVAQPAPVAPETAAPVVAQPAVTPAPTAQPAPVTPPTTAPVVAQPAATPAPAVTPAPTANPTPVAQPARLPFTAESLQERRQNELNERLGILSAGAVPDTTQSFQQIYQENVQFQNQLDEIDKQSQIQNFETEVSQLQSEVTAAPEGSTIRNLKKAEWTAKLNELQSLLASI